VSGRPIDESRLATAGLTGRHGAAGAAPVATRATRAFPTLGGECSTRHPASAYRRKSRETVPVRAKSVNLLREGQRT
jgi:hypothetical protein